MESKQAISSRTIWTSATLFITSLTGLILHFTGVLPISPEMLGGTIAGAVSGLVFLVLRIVTSAPIQLGEDANRASEGGGTVLLVLLLIPLMTCCTTIRARRTVDLHIRQGPPCQVTIDVDGKRAVQVSGPKRCEVR